SATALSSVSKRVYHGVYDRVSGGDRGYYREVFARHGVMKLMEQPTRDRSISAFLNTNERDRGLGTGGGIGGGISDSFGGAIGDGFGGGIGNGVSRVLGIGNSSGIDGKSGGIDGRSGGRGEESGGIYGRGGGMGERSGRINERSGGIGD
ncbi:unnamed protein product, partial [Laminaria digitata]